MVDITNISRASLGYVTGQKDGQPVVAAVNPGETRPIDVPADHPAVVADVTAGLISVGRPAPKPRPAKAD